MSRGKHNKGMEILPDCSVAATTSCKSSRAFSEIPFIADMAILMSPTIPSIGRKGLKRYFFVESYYVKTCGAGRPRFEYRILKSSSV